MNLPDCPPTCSCHGLIDAPRSPVDRAGSPRTGSVDSTTRDYRGVRYYPTYEAARVERDRIGVGRLVQYGRGWAIQERISGPYWSGERFQ